jgi:hypothetical protein
MLIALDEAHCSVDDWGLVETTADEQRGGECVSVSSLGMWDLLAANLALNRVVLLPEAALPIPSLISQSLEYTLVKLFVSPTPVREAVTEQAPSAILLHCSRHTHYWAYPAVLASVAVYAMGHSFSLRSQQSTGNTNRPISAPGNLIYCLFSRTRPTGVALTCPVFTNSKNSLWLAQKKKPCCIEEPLEEVLSFCWYFERWDHSGD